MTSTFGFNFSDTYSKLPKEFVKKSDLYPFVNPQHQIFNSSLALQLGLDEKAIRESNYIFANGSNLPQGASAIAQAYCGHQFGHFVKLGDGRALLLGEHVTPDQKRYDIQLKGSGPTEFSRGGDGFAALGPMLREYLISESINALGIPTTRSLSVISTGQPVFRETTLKGAMLTRVAESHIRVGTFQYASINGKDHVRELAEYTIQRHFADLNNQEKKFEALLLRIIDLQSQLIAQWMSVGFIHGVMNTDNMSICGETIDYGPCAFMNHYKQDTVFSSIDRNGRYAYGNQPMIAHWNLTRFAESLLILFDEDIDIAKEKALSILSLFKEKYSHHWLNLMAKKIGIENSSRVDETFINEFLTLLEKHEADFTNSFRNLNNPHQLKRSLTDDDLFVQWNKKRINLIGKENIHNSQKLMDSINPCVIPRNHLVEQSLDDANNGNLETFYELVQVIQHPYSMPENQKYLEPPSLEYEQSYRTFCGT